MRFANGLKWIKSQPRTLTRTLVQCFTIVPCTLVQYVSVFGMLNFCMLFSNIKETNFMPTSGLYDGSSVGFTLFYKIRQETEFSRLEHNDTKLW